MSEKALETPLLLPEGVDEVQRISLFLGGIATIACFAGFALDRSQFFRSYLVAYLYFLGIALGCLALDMMHRLTGGAWGEAARDILAAGTRTVPLLAVLFVPFVFGMPDLFAWARPEESGVETALAGRHAYLNVGFFWVRAAVYFAVWWSLARVVARRGNRGEVSAEERRRRQAVSGVGLVAYFLTATFASVDWLLSLDPSWYSTIYGIYFVGTHALGALSLVAIAGFFLSRRQASPAPLEARHFHDWGNLLLAFIMLWAYFALSQFLVIWMGNISEEVAWYVHRERGGWVVVSALLVVLQFFVPFVVLLSRRVKRSARRLAVVGVLIAATRWLDLYWQVGPTFYERVRFHLLDAATVLAVGGLWLAIFLQQLRRRTPLPGAERIGG